MGHDGKIRYLRACVENLTIILKELSTSPIESTSPEIIISK